MRKVTARYATRHDPTSLIETRLQQLETPRGFLYTCLERPQGTRACVVICSSVFGDFAANYHRERVLARELAAYGIAALRFHYAGEGNSEGDREDMTLWTLCSDAELVADHAGALGYDTIAFVGTRLGALVAAKSSSKWPSAPVVFWQPITNPLRYISDAYRAKRMSSVTQGDEGVADDWREELDQKGVLDLLGYDVHPSFIASIQGVTFDELVGGQKRDILIASFKSQREGIEDFAEIMRDRGHVVTEREFEVSEAWWFDRETRPDTADLIPATASWLSERIVGRGH